MVSHNVAVMDDSESIQIHNQSLKVYILYIMRHWAGQGGGGRTVDWFRPYDRHSGYNRSGKIMVLGFMSLKSTLSFKFQGTLEIPGTRGPKIPLDIFIISIYYRDKGVMSYEACYGIH